MKRIIALVPVGAAIIATVAFAQTPPPAAPSQAVPKTVSDETAKAPPPPALTDAKTGTMYVSENAQDLMSSKMVGAKVSTPNDETVGEVADLMLSQDGTLRAVVISVGGVLGVGSRYVAVAPGALKVSRADDKSIKVVLQASKNDLTTAPEFKYQGKDT